jgi:hypothetical protein
MQPQPATNTKPTNIITNANRWQKQSMDARSRIVHPVAGGVFLTCKLTSGYWAYEKTGSILAEKEIVA